MIDQVHQIDCLVGLPKIPDRQVDLVFADLPYGRTQNNWDRLVPLDRLWQQLRRVRKTAAPCVFTAIQPFTSLLVMSNLREFRYAMVWRKNKPRGHLNAKRQPLRVHEDIVVFYAKQPRYTPLMTAGHRPVNSFYTRRNGRNYGSGHCPAGGGSTLRYPVSVLDISVVNNDSPEHVHSTQKPVDLALFFIETYTRTGDLVLDPTCGSGSTLVAAQRAGRHFVGFDIDRQMTAHARKWLTREAKA